MAADLVVTSQVTSLLATAIVPLYLIPPVLLAALCCFYVPKMFSVEITTRE